MARNASRAVTYPIDMTVDVNPLMAALEKLERDLKEKVLRSAAFAGANVFYLEMRQRVPVAEGSLFSAIYQWHDDKSTPDKQTYFIGPNKRKAPHWYFIEYGHFLYNRQIDGKWQRSKESKNARGVGAHTLPGALAVPKWIPPQPYVRPTWESKRAAALTAMKQRMTVRFKEITSGQS